MILDYDDIGSRYTETRGPDPRIAKQIIEALGDAASVVNVGAGAGAYEPQDRFVIAVEPAMTMIRQRHDGTAAPVQGAAEDLPLADNSVDAALAILTVHHWTDPIRGLREMRRVARHRIVIFTWDQAVWESFWLVRDYFPCIREIDRQRAVAINDITTVMGECRIVTVPVPHDCMDGFHGAFWRRPQAYLDPRIRAGISTYALMSQDEIETGVGKLTADISNGSWRERYPGLLNLDELDLGYRLIIAE